jgi:hypothetical protein
MPSKPAAGGRVLTSVLSIVAVFGVVSCRSEAVPTAAPPPFDLCSALTVDDVAAAYGESNLPLTVTKHIEETTYLDSGMASCQYGEDTLPAMTLAVHLGDPVLDVAELVGGQYDKDGTDLTIGSDKAFYRETPGSGGEIAVGHGNTQFVLSWRPLSGSGSGQRSTVSESALIDAATTVASRLPTDLVLPQRDIASQCDAVTEVEGVIGGVIMARGSADAKTLNCDYLGPDGVLTTTAVAESDKNIERDIRLDQEASPEDIVDPPVADDAVLLIRGRVGGLRLEGNLRECCSVDVRNSESQSDSDTDDAGSGTGLDGADRGVTTGFLDAARTWAREQ